MAAWLLAQAVLTRVRRAGDPGRELEVRRRLQGLVVLEHVSLAAGLSSGLALLHHQGWGLGQARWLGLKLGLVVFLVVPLEGMHAYINHVWIARGLRGTAAPPFSRELSRGIGMDDMVRTLTLLLLGVGVPLLTWLSVRKPF